MGSVIFENVTKMYGEKVGIKDVSLEIYEDEFLVIVGPSGAGKTTTLKVIAGLLDITEGNLYIDGRNVNKIPPRDRNVAMTFESYALYPHYTVFENMANPLRAPHMNFTEKEIEEKVERIAGMLEIDHLLERFPKELSGGQKQRVSLGRAMVREPSVFLLDEPLSHVDAKVRHRMRLELNRLQKELNATTVYVTHDYVEGLSLADRIVILNEGEIIQVGTPHEIYNDPLNEFVATHVGQPEMNIFDALVSLENGKIILTNQESNKIKFVLEGDTAELVKNHGKNKVRVGIRPQDIKITSQEKGDFNGKVYVYEPFVTYGILTVNVRGIQLQILTEHDSQFNIGDNIALKVNPDDLYLFDKESGMNLEHL
ncbi:ABC transporter ATP-binding protein [Halothermothrix orenii]|uniref:ABC transporter related n=1 Tax=Halothermothrix orenii (strain H 168 / OCM 544 / DSM 9562) TaxID=373903 RepID=B8D1L6_HALOH|nr:ABC transporter ATP-binding protein [Halothermothrix orenii]ACL69093.1 ABC transporter related [Halothermothrix orenii H 168]